LEAADPMSSDSGATKTSRVPGAEGDVDGPLLAAVAGDEIEMFPIPVGDSTADEPEAKTQQDERAENLGGALMVFPPETPEPPALTPAKPITERQQATESLTPRKETAPPVAPMPAQQKETSVEDPEVVQAVMRAIDAIEAYSQVEAAGGSSRELLVARLSAYRRVSEVAGLPMMDQDDPCVVRLLERLVEFESLKEFGGLATDWVPWQRRSTDGILLVGSLRQRDGRTVYRLADGNEFEVTNDSDFGFASETRTVMLAKLTGTADPTKVRLLAGAVAD
jgi:hypothetical protein